MTTTDHIAQTLTERFGAVRIEGVRLTGRNEHIGQAERQYETGCTIAVGRMLSASNAVDGRRAALSVTVFEGEEADEDNTRPDVFAFDRVEALRAALDWIESEFDPTATNVSDVEEGVEIDTAASPAIRRTAYLLECSLATAAYINALENRVAALEEKVGELRYDVRRVRRAA